jgi:uncharacterized membrane protein
MAMPLKALSEKSDSVQQSPTMASVDTTVAASALRTMFRNNARLWWSMAIGIVTFALLPREWSLVSRVLAGWDTAIVVLIPIIVLHMRNLDGGRLRAHYEGDDPSAPVILLLVVVAALLSVVAIVMLLSGSKGLPNPERAARGALAAVTIVASWVFVPTMFTLHYADAYYSASPECPPLGFPRTEEPVFWDFVYFSFTIAVACQTADVATHNAPMRRLVAIHSVISFAFNLAILGFAINVTAGFLQGN